MSEYDFQGQIRWTFTKSTLEKCVHCGRGKEEHTNNKCLFEPTQFEAHPLTEFFSDLLRNGGEFAITTGLYTLKQKMNGRALDQLPSRVTADIDTVGPATLRETNAKVRT